MVAEDHGGPLRVGGQLRADRGELRLADVPALQMRQRGVHAEDPHRPGGAGEVALPGGEMRPEMVRDRLPRAAAAAPAGSALGVVVVVAAHREPVPAQPAGPVHDPAEALHLGRGVRVGAVAVDHQRIRAGGADIGDQPGELPFGGVGHPGGAHPFADVRVIGDRDPGQPGPRRGVQGAEPPGELGAAGPAGGGQGGGGAQRPGAAFEAVLPARLQAADDHMVHPAGPVVVVHHRRRAGVGGAEQHRLRGGHRRPGRPVGGAHRPAVGGPGQRHGGVGDGGDLQVGGVRGRPGGAVQHLLGDQGRRLVAGVARIGGPGVRRAPLPGHLR